MSRHADAYYAICYSAVDKASYAVAATLLILLHTRRHYCRLLTLRYYYCFAANMLLYAGFRVCCRYVRRFVFAMIIRWLRCLYYADVTTSAADF